MSKVLIDHQLVEGTIGWAVTRFVIDGHVHEMCHGYLENPLLVLARAAVSLALGSGLAPTEALFDCEPGGYVAVLSHRDPTRFQLWSTPNHYGDSIERRTLVTDTEVDSVALAGEIGNVLHRLLAEHGLLGYAHRWHEHSFPLPQYITLRALLDQSPAGCGLREPPRTTTLDRELAALSEAPQWSNVRLISNPDDWPVPPDVVYPG